MMSTRLGEYVKSSIDTGLDIFLRYQGVYGEERFVGTVSALLGAAVMRRPGIVKSLTAVLAGFVVLAGCAARVEPPPGDALPLEVFETYVRAIQANDERAGRAMSGDCWFRVAEWFAPGGVIDHYEISAESLNSDQPPPSHLTSYYISFKYWTKTGKLREHMIAMLERDDEHSPWRMCEIFDLYAP